MDAMSGAKERYAQSFHPPRHGAIPADLWAQRSGATQSMHLHLHNQQVILIDLSAAIVRCEALLRRRWELSSGAHIQISDENPQPHTSDPS